MSPNSPQGRSLCDREGCGYSRRNVCGGEEEAGSWWDLRGGKMVAIEVR